MPSRRPLLVVSQPLSKSLPAALLWPSLPKSCGSKLLNLARGSKLPCAEITKLLTQIHLNISYTSLLATSRLGKQLPHCWLRPCVVSLVLCPSRCCSCRSVVARSQLSFARSRRASTPRSATSGTRSASLCTPRSAPPGLLVCQLVLLLDARTGKHIFVTLTK